ncbi:MAG: carboxypeptidase regulatory-like domain-containing protein [Acholeplasmatales bacterium]|jgi:hypothetical protein|nr:carboxypeptidase regulatory-like domain-containing protein [Acholeplasmatales bacterium]
MKIKKSKVLKISTIILCSLLVIFAGMYLMASDVYVDYTYTKTPGNDQFDFPGNYEAPELVIDGIDTLGSEWSNIPVLTTFGNSSNASVKVYRGDKAIFFFFEVSDNVLLTKGNSNDDSVTHSDSIELYLDTLNDGGLKPQTDDYQLNFGIHNKTRIMQGSGSNWGAWNGLIDYEVKLYGILNDNDLPEDTGYSIEVMIPYKQISINKNSPIGISFGIVNKTGLGDITSTDWDWYGWNFEGSVREPQAPNNYVSLVYDPLYTYPNHNILSNNPNFLVDRNSIPKPDVTLFGTVTDKYSFLPLEGVLITNGVYTTLTESDGSFIFYNVSSNETIVFDVTFENYYMTHLIFTRDELREANGGYITKNIGIVSELNAPKTSVSGTVKNVFDGFIKDANVSVLGTVLSTTTAADGTFSIENVPVSGNILLTVSKDGYVSENITILESSVFINETTNIPGFINLSYAYNTENASFGGARGQNLFVFQTTRSLTGVRFTLTTNTKFEGPESAILYLYGGVLEAANLTDRRVHGLKFYASGTIGRDKSGGIWSTAVQSPTTNIKYSVVHNEDIELGAVLYIEIPYTFFTSTFDSFSVFGFSAGSNCYEGGSLGWDGFGYDGFVEPNNPEDYIRVNYLNQLYKASNNSASPIVTGFVYDNLGNPLENVTVEGNGVNTLTSQQGKYILTFSSTNDELIFKAHKSGYNWGNVIVPSNYFSSNVAFVNNFVLEEKIVYLSGISSYNGEPIQGEIIAVLGTAITTLTSYDGSWSLEVTTYAPVTLSLTYNDLTVTKLLTLGELNSENVDFIIVNDLIFSSGVVSINGFVTDYLGNYIQNATVSILDTIFSTVTNSSGYYNFDNVPKDNMILEITYPNYTLSQKIISVALLESPEVVTYDAGSALLYPTPDYFNATFGKEASNADNFYVSVERDDISVTFNFFSYTNSFSSDELVLLYLDLNSVTTDGWASDALYKIKGDGSVYARYKDSPNGSYNKTQDNVTAWWSASVNNQVGSIVINRVNGYTYFSLTLLYSTFNSHTAINNQVLDVNQNTIIGFSAREALHNLVDHALYDPWYDFYYKNENASWSSLVLSSASGIDAAAESAYVRISPEGTLFRKSSNTFTITVTGVVTNILEVPLEGVNVTVNGFSVLTDVNGEYTLSFDFITGEFDVLFKKNGYVWDTQTINDTLFSWNTKTQVVNSVLVSKEVTLEGVVTDALGSSIASATVLVTDNAFLEYTTLSDPFGAYIITGVSAFTSLQIFVSKDGYELYVSSITLSELNLIGSVVVKNIVLSAGSVNLKGKVIDIYQEVAGATINVVGNTSVLSEEDGTFEILNVSYTMLTVNISYPNHITRTIVIPYSSLEIYEDYLMGDIYLSLEEADMGIFASGNEKPSTVAKFSSFRAYVTRGEIGFEFRFVSSVDVFNYLDDHIELFISTKTTHTNGNRNHGDYKINIYQNSTIAITDFGSPKNESLVSGMVVSINRDNGTVVKFILPYNFFGVKDTLMSTNNVYSISREETVGFSLGEWAEEVNKTSDWDGYVFSKGGSINYDNFVVPEYTKDYVRLSTDNVLYNSEFNALTSVRLNDYQVHFGSNIENNHANNNDSSEGADQFYARVTRDQVGITFNIIGFNDFNNEFINLYLDLNDTLGSAWNIDRTYKIKSDGTVYQSPSNSPWFVPSEVNQVFSLNSNIIRENNVTYITLVLTYTSLGIQSDAIIGFVLREAKNINDNPPIVPWYDCFYKTASASWNTYSYVSENACDGANESTYIRIDENGELFRNTSNTHLV